MKEELKKRIIAKEKEIEFLLKHESWGAAEGNTNQLIHLIERYESCLSSNVREKQYLKNAQAGLLALSKNENHHYVF